MLSDSDVRLLTPELIVVLTATAIYLLGAFLPGRSFWGLVGLAGLAAAGFTLVGQFETLKAADVHGPLSADALGHYVRLMALVVGGVLVLAGSRPQNESLTPEFVGTLMMAVSGVMLVGSARELVMLFLGLELISIPTYVLLFIGRRDGAGSESAAKYFFLSILSSGLTLYGFSFLYGVGGSTDLANIQAALAHSPAESKGVPVFAQLALVLMFAGLGFKIAAVPFHFYAPDVYQGTTHVNAGVLAVLPKIAGITALVRIVSIAMPGVEETAVRVALILALVTMTLGNVTALWQDDLRRMFAYSSIAHAGYMLIGLAVDFAASTPEAKESGLVVEGIGATLFYVGVYSAATAGTFAALAYLGGKAKQIDTVDDLAGVGRSQPAVALCLAIFMFSLAGIPPLAGFWGKLSLFSGAVKVGMEAGSVKLAGWFLVLAVVGVLNAAVSAAYYLRIIGAMYFRDAGPAPAPAEGGLGAKLATLACGLMVLGIGLGPRSLAGFSDDAAKAARGEAPAVAAPHPAPHPTHQASR